MNTRKFRIVSRILYVFFLGFAIALFAGLLVNRQFAGGDLKRWQEATAKVTASKVTNEALGPQERRESLDDRGFWIRKYTVRYTYTAEFTAWGKTFSFDHEGTNSGETDLSATAIPQSAYNFPKQGETLAVIYDPANEGAYKLGSIADWQKAGELSFANLIVPCVFLLIAAVLIMIDAVGIKRRRTDKEILGRLNLNGR